MRIAENAEMLELETALANGPGIMSPLILWDDSDAVLFDTGLPGMSDIILKSAYFAGVPAGRLNRILITHSDMDHIGCLSELIRKSGKIEVFAHCSERPYIECELPPVRSKKIEETANSVTGEMRAQLLELSENLKRNYKLFEAKVDKTVNDGEMLPFCGGIKCIYTPGHTPGHMSYFVEKLNLLFTGDLLQIDKGRLDVCPDFTILDKTAFASSLKKIMQYDINTVVCFHGGLFTGDASNRITEISEAYARSI